MNRVAIILVNWNGLQDTLACMASIEEQSYRDCAVIVVDNNSREDPSEIVARYPSAVLIRNPDNLGFCGGNNIGIRKAIEIGADYCWILNNDTEIAPDCLGHLVDALNQNSELAAVGHPIIYHADKRLYWFTGGVFRRGIPAHRNHMKPVVEGDPIENSTEFLTGCSFLARTCVLKELGGFDENYFCYVEDVDLSMRILALGERIGYAPRAVVWHKVSRSTGGACSPIMLYYWHRNMLYFLRKFRRPTQVKLRWWLISARFAASLLLKHHKPSAAWYLGRGLIHGAMGYTGKIGESRPGGVNTMRFDRSKS